MKKVGFFLGCFLFLIYVVLSIQRVLQIISMFILDKILEHLLSNSIVYNAAVEDPRQDKELLKIKPGEDVIAVITTGSCNVLDRAVDNPKKIYSVDCNQAQNNLLEIRVACIKKLSHEEMWKIWGDLDYSLLREKYKDTIRPELSPVAQKYWDKNIKKIKNWHYEGSVGKIVRGYIGFLKIVGIKEFIELCVKDNTTVEQQRKAWLKVRDRMKSVTKLTWSAISIFGPFLGVPPRQISIVKGNLLFDMFDHVFLNTHIAKENYIFYAYMKGKYSKQCRPRYLTPEGFATLKSNLENNPKMISVHTAMLEDVLKTVVKPNELTIAILLDSMDWMNDMQVRKQLRLLKTRMNTEKGRILFRSASATLTQPDLASTLDYDVELVDEVKRKLPCLLGSYPGTFLGRFNNKKSSDVAYMPFPNNSLMDDLTVFKEMYFGKLGTKKQQEERLEMFYRNQADKYDGYRQYMLHGRNAMISSIPLDEEKPLVWADFGCGTGSNFELIEQKYIKKMYGLDLCQPLLNIAKERIRKMGATDKAKLIKADVSKPVKEIKDNSVDLVTFSYSICMIPDWKSAIKEGLRVLKKGGYLAVSDFTTNPNHLGYSNYFWKKCFEFDHISITQQHTQFLQEVADCKLLYIGEGGFPYIPLAQAPYMVFMGTKK